MTVLHCPVWQQLCQVELWHATFNVFVYLHVMAFFNEIDSMELIDQQEATGKHSVIKIQDIHAVESKSGMMRVTFISLKH